MATYFNRRIEGPFAETFKGYNQFLVSGGVDDLFLMDIGRGRTKLFKIAEAYRQYGLNAKYEIVVTVKTDLTLDFAEPAMRDFYRELASGTSDRLVDSAHAGRARRFVPKGRTPTTAKASGNASRQQDDSAAPAASRKAEEEVRDRLEGRDSVNELDRIRRVLAIGFSSYFPKQTG